MAKVFSKRKVLGYVRNAILAIGLFSAFVFISFSATSSTMDHSPRANHIAIFK